MKLTHRCSIFHVSLQDDERGDENSVNKDRIGPGGYLLDLDVAKGVNEEDEVDKAVGVEGDIDKFFEVTDSTSTASTPRSISRL